MRETRMRASVCSERERPRATAIAADEQREDDDIRAARSWRGEEGGDAEDPGAATASAASGARRVARRARSGRGAAARAAPAGAPAGAAALRAARRRRRRARRSRAEREQRAQRRAARRARRRSGHGAPAGDLRAAEQPRRWRAPPAASRRRRPASHQIVSSVSLCVARPGGRAPNTPAAPASARVAASVRGRGGRAGAVQRLEGASTRRPTPRGSRARVH